MARFLFQATKIDRGEDGKTWRVDDTPPFELELDAKDNGDAIAKGITDFRSKHPDKHFDDYVFGSSSL